VDPHPFLPMGGTRGLKTLKCAVLIWPPTLIATTISLCCQLPRKTAWLGKAQIAEWLFGDGEEVTEGEALFLLEADKSTNEVEAPATGTLRIVGIEGETYEVGTVIGYIE
jgi:hypothetical protein